MRWNCFTIKTIVDAEDMIIASLADLGIEGVEITDSQPLSEEDKAQMFVDIMPDSPENDGTASLSFYLEETEEQEAVLSEVREMLDSLRTFMDIGEGTVEVSQTEDKDWINNWKEYFHQFSVDDILIVPSWEEASPEDADKLILHIDPGTAFGTGMHETTQLVHRQITKHLQKGDEVLDIGTGSGILGIAALKMGAGHVSATDLDPCAVNAVAENLEANDISPEDFILTIGNLIDDPETQEWAGKACYDLVTANILTEVLLPLTPVAAACLKEGGYYITSGILEGKETLVAEAAEKAGLTVTEITKQGEWMSVTARKGA